MTERRPPYNLDAERGLLGAMLLARQARDTALSLITVDDLYKPDHQRAFLAIERLALEQAAIDPVTVAAAGGGELAELIQLMSDAPSTSAAVGYAQIVALAAQRRRTLALAGEITEAVYDGRDPAGWIAQLGEQTAAGQDGTTWQPADLSAAVDGTQPDPPVWLHRSDGICLLYPGKLHLLNGDSESGKAQPLDSLIATPHGWRRMGDMMVGDEVFASDGCPTRVIGVYPQGQQPIYRLSCSDGSSVECTPDHLWHVQTNNHRGRGQRGVVLTTSQIAHNLATKSGRNDSLYLPMMRPTETTPADLELDPYLLGALLGDGGLTKNVTFTSGDNEMFGYIADALPEGDVLHLRDHRTASIVGRRTLSRLRALGIHGHKSENKWIPDHFLQGSIAQRMELLRGLMDTDGTMSRSAIFSTSSPLLASGVRELVESLGGTAATSFKWPHYIHRGVRMEGRKAYLLTIRIPHDLGPPFRLRRKVDLWKARQLPAKCVPPMRRIVSVDYIGTKDAQCIAVDAPDRLYATEHYLLTHNSWLATGAVVEAITAGLPALYVDFEDTAATFAGRLLALGVSRDLILALVHYIRPEDPYDDRAKLHLGALLESRPYAVAVLDGMAEALAANGWKENAAEDIMAFYDALPRRIARYGAATVMIDHLVKNKEEQGRYGRGSGAKLNGVDGAVYKVVCDHPFGRGRSGKAHMILSKDRPGWVRQGHPGLQPNVADVNLESMGDNGDIVTLKLSKPAGHARGPEGEWQPTLLMEKISRALENTDTPNTGVTERHLCALVSGKAELVKHGIAALAARGYIHAAPSGRSLTYRSVRPYRDTEPEEEPAF